MCKSDTKKHIVIASSDTDFRDSLKKILEESMYAVDKVCSDGIDTVISMTGSCADALFIDEKTGFLDTKSVIEKVRKKGYQGLVFTVCEKYSEDSPFNSVSDGTVVKPVTKKFLIPWLYAKFKKQEEYNSILKEKNDVLEVLDGKKMWQEAAGLIAASEKICISSAEIILSEKIAASGMKKEVFLREMLSV